MKMECPMCKETIQDGAIKCKHCGSDLSKGMAEDSSTRVAQDVPTGFACYTYAWKNFAQFSGRARRQEYWMFTLFHVLVMIGLSFIDGLIGTFSPGAGLGLLSGLYMLAVLVPAIAVGVRRLHDTGRSGWWLLISFVPLVGVIIIIVLMALDSKESGDKYGVPRKKIPA